MTRPSVLLIGLIAFTLAAGCKRDAQDTAAPAPPPPPPAPAAPTVNPFANPPPWAPDPLAVPLPSSTGSIAAPASPAPSASSRVALERTLATSKNLSDVQRARDMLEPRVFGHTATHEELGLLLSICKAQHDKVCVQQVQQVSSQ